MNYVLHIAIISCCFAILAISLDLLAGHTGLLALAHAAFYGLGAYTSALLAVHFGLPFPLGVAAGMIMAAGVSFLVSLPSLRLHDDYFVIATFGFQMILLSVFKNWTGLTRGPMGIAGIPQPSLAGVRLASPMAWLALALAFTAIAFFIVQRITTAPLGRVLRAIREDELFARAVGKNTVRFKVMVFAVSAALAASAGSLYAHYTTYIDPTSFTVMESILVVSMVIIGGAGSPWGPVLGAVVLVALPEALRFVGLPSGIAANLRQVLYGSLLVAMMLVRPRGLLGRYALGA